LYLHRIASETLLEDDEGLEEEDSTCYRNTFNICREREQKNPSNVNLALITSKGYSGKVETENTKPA
jgi:hypothetical protein